MIWNLEKERKNLESAIQNRELNFTAKFMAVCNLHSLIQTNPEIVTIETVSALEDVLKDSNISSQRQSLFVYREAAEALTSIIVKSSKEVLTRQAISTLENIMDTTTGHPHRASTEALGSLPLSIQGPKINQSKIKDIPLVDWREILEQKNIKTSTDITFTGRSLAIHIDEPESILIIKLALITDSPQSIYQEALWLEHLGLEDYTFPVRFNIPVTIKIQGSPLFRLKTLPLTPKGIELHPELYAVGFIADKSYFSYPNNRGKENRLTSEEIKEVMFRNAYLLGKLASSGIIHSAPIPLFHNRVQSHRRPDNGLYEWPRGGRLDRWLDSCSYPNFGLTGLRDFEHFVAFNGSGRRLYYYIGTHLLSLLLVSGSYFRNKEPERIGQDPQGKPVDARDLFDKLLLKELIQGIFSRYYYGFVGRVLNRNMPLDLDRLTSRMIDEMGVDRHMEEVLRAVDQKQMSDEDFMEFLKERGYSRKKIKGLKKGIEDLIVYTGPHLGEFNQNISLPELIEAVGAVSALCIAGSYWKEKHDRKP